MCLLPIASHYAPVGHYVRTEKYTRAQQHAARPETNQALATDTWPQQLSRYSNSLGLEGPGIESRWWRDFLHPSRPALGPTQSPILSLCRG